jgi:hypothetical protein
MPRQISGAVFTTARDKRDRPVIKNSKILLAEAFERWLRGKLALIRQKGQVGGCYPLCALTLGKSDGFIDDGSTFFFKWIGAIKDCTGPQVKLKRCPPECGSVGNASRGSRRPSPRSRVEVKLAQSCTSGPNPRFFWNGSRTL